MKHIKQREAIHPAVWNGMSRLALFCRSRNVRMLLDDSRLLFVFAAFVVIEIESIDKIAEER